MHKSESVVVHLLDLPILAHILSSAVAFVEAAIGDGFAALTERLDNGKAV